MMEKPSFDCDTFYVMDFKLKYQTLLNEYLKLQKEYVSRKRKLEAAKGKRERILAEVRFLRRKRGCLSTCQAPKIEKLPPCPPKSDALSNQCTSPKSLDQKTEDGEADLHEKEAMFMNKVEMWGSRRCVGLINSL